MTTSDPPTGAELCELARTAALSAYAPYSSFRVGAAVRTKNGTFLGANVENASYGLTLCAERSALAAAITAGEREIEAVGLACIDADPARGDAELVPCGACRQWLAELAPNAKLYVAGRDGSFEVGELLPTPFRFRE